MDPLPVDARFEQVVCLVVDVWKIMLMVLSDQESVMFRSVGSGRGIYDRKKAHTRLMTFVRLTSFTFRRFASFLEMTP